MVQDAFRELSAVLGAAGDPLPQNRGGTDLVDRKLDCAVIGTLHERRDDLGKRPFDTVRAAFFEGGPLYDNAGFAARNHIQVCVRSHRGILGYFRPLDEDGTPIRFA